MPNETQKPANQQKNTPPQGGRPGKAQTAPGDVKAARLANLQYALDRACNFINDGGASYSARARGAARAGVPQETVLRGLAAMEQAVKDARQVVERAYAAPEKAAAPKSRVALVG